MCAARQPLPQCVYSPVAYRDLKVNDLLGESRHFVVEAEAVLARVVRGEDEVALALLGALHHAVLVGADDLIVDIEAAARLDLQSRLPVSIRMLPQSLPDAISPRRLVLFRLAAKFAEWSGWEERGRTAK